MISGITSELGPGFKEPTVYLELLTPGIEDGYAVVYNIVDNDITDEGKHASARLLYEGNPGDKLELKMVVVDDVERLVGPYDKMEELMSLIIKDENTPDSGFAVSDRSGNWVMIEASQQEDLGYRIINTPSE